MTQHTIRRRPTEDFPFTNELIAAVVVGMGEEIYRFDPKHTQADLGSAFLGFDKIEVRNYAAHQILTILGITLPLDDKTSEASWVRVREFVEEEVERRLESERKK